MLLVGNGCLITRDESVPVLRDGCVAIEDGRITERGLTRELRDRHPHARFVDARGRLIMPGLINTHMHLYSTFARGMALKDDAPGNFLEILERLWWRLDKAFTLDDVYLSAMVPLVECIKCGVTTIFDHHASPGAVSGSLFRIAEATRQAGVRACLCYEVSDRDGEEVAERGIEENRAFLEHCRNHNDGMLAAMFGLHASFTVSDRTLRRAKDVADSFDAGFHVHTAEGPEDLAHCQKTYGQRIVERFHQHGILGDKTLAVHCVHVNDDEMDLLRQSGTSVVHNPESNMGNAVGTAPVLRMLERGVRVGLGTDGYTCDMLESMKAANLLHKHQAGKPGAAWAEPPAMLFAENAAIATKHFNREIGKLVPGACGDVIVVDYDPPTPLDASNVNGHLLFGVSGRSVVTTVADGKVLMEDRKLETIDEEQLMVQARAAAARLWQRF